jgi:hypothetical protein
MTQAMMTLCVDLAIDPGQIHTQICVWIWPSIRAGQLQVGHWSEVNLKFRTLFYQCPFTNRIPADFDPCSGSQGLEHVCFDLEAG